MKGLSLTVTEKEKYRMIRKVLSGKISVERCAIILGLSKRRVRQLMRICEQEGLSAFSHKSKGRTPSNASSPELLEKIVELYSNKYAGFNFKHFQEKLQSDEQITVSYGLLYKTLSNAGIVSPKANRKKAKAVVHPTRPRKESFGQLIQMDASVHLWFGKDKSFLHAAIDDATGQIVGAYFDTQETLNGYFHVFHDILCDHGIPMAFYTDRRTIFEYKHKNTKEIENDTFTQFATACDRLGVEIITTSVPQAKGRVERLFNTLQDRLISEMRLAGIETIEQANGFLKRFIPTFNQQFALPIDYAKSVMELAPSAEEINLYLSVFTARKVDNGSVIKYKKKIYAPYKNDQRIHLPAKTEVVILKAFDGELFILEDKHIYPALEVVVDKHQQAAEANLPPQGDGSSRQSYKPKPNHPWRAGFYKRRIEEHSGVS